LDEVFISYAQAEAGWVRALGERLESCGVKVFAKWRMLPGDSWINMIDEAMGHSTNAILVLSPASAAEPWVREEYAALFNASVKRGLRFIPVIYGDVDIPSFAATKVPVDFRNATGQTYDDKVAGLIRAIQDPLHAADGQIVSAEAVGTVLPSRPKPLTEPDQPAFVVCYAAADAGYGERLADLLESSGLPVWSLRRLIPGDDPFWIIRRQLKHALGVVVLMSPESQDSDDITLMILEGKKHGRMFIPILLRGERNYHLANSWYVDAGDGDLPGPDVIAILRRLRQAHQGDRGLTPSQVLPAPLAQPPVPAVRIPASVELDQLRASLGDQEFVHADLLTTSLLLEAADRLEKGFMLPAHGRRLPDGLLAGIDALWSSASGGRYGFRAQLRLAKVARVRHADFLAASVRYGWRASTDDSVTRYEEFTARAGACPGFFPTLRNPQTEQYLDWYDQWTETVLAVHTRLRKWEGH
jgi:hypothetical protein